MRIWQQLVQEAGIMFTEWSTLMGDTLAESPPPQPLQPLVSSLLETSFIMSLINQVNELSQLSQCRPITNLC